MSATHRGTLIGFSRIGLAVCGSFSDLSNASLRILLPVPPLGLAPCPACLHRSMTPANCRDYSPARSTRCCTDAEGKVADDVTRRQERLGMPGTLACWTGLTQPRDCQLSGTVLFCAAAHKAPLVHRCHSRVHTKDRTWEERSPSVADRDWHTAVGGPRARIWGSLFRGTVFLQSLPAAYTFKAA